MKVFTVLIFGLFGFSNGKLFEKDELADILRSKGLEDINSWICVILTESGGRSESVFGPGHDGSFKYGLFQVDGNIWCDVGKRGCGIPCSKLTDDEIDDDIECAQKIFKKYGFSAWPGWRKYCAGKQNGEDGRPCVEEGGTCISKDECENGISKEKIKGVWACPYQPKEVWCCLPKDYMFSSMKLDAEPETEKDSDASNESNTDTACADAGGECTSHKECKKWNGHVKSSIPCPNSSENTKCCLREKSPCENAGGKCTGKHSCSHPKRKIHGKKSCPTHSRNEYCCIENKKKEKESPCSKAGGVCKHKKKCSHPHKRINGKRSCPNDPKDVWCCDK